MNDSIARRRGTLQLLAALAAAPFVGRAQTPSASVPRVGLLHAGSPVVSGPFVEAFRGHLRELGHVDGRNVVLEVRFGDGKERLREAAAEFARMPVAVMVAFGPGPATAAHEATSTIPIVMGNHDPVEQGLIASFGRPAGNITGWSFVSAEVAGKQMQLLKESVAGLSRIGVLTNPESPGNAGRIAAIEMAGRALGLRVQVMDVTRPEALEPAFAAASRSHIEALIVLAEPMVVDQLRPRITALAARDRLPAMYLWRAYVAQGGLMSYGPKLPALMKRMAYFVDRILKGAKPSDLPVERPLEYEFVINLKVADALGLVLPQQLLLRASEVIR